MQKCPKSICFDILPNYTSLNIAKIPVRLYSKFYYNAIEVSILNYCWYVHMAYFKVPSIRPKSRIWVEGWIKLEKLEIVGKTWKKLAKNLKMLEKLEQFGNKLAKNLKMLEKLENRLEINWPKLGFLGFWGG